MDTVGTSNKNQLSKQVPLYQAPPDTSKMGPVKDIFRKMGYRVFDTDPSFTVTTLPSYVEELTDPRIDRIESRVANPKKMAFVTTGAVQHASEVMRDREVFTISIYKKGAHLSTVHCPFNESTLVKDYFLALKDLLQSLSSHQLEFKVPALLS